MDEPLHPVEVFLAASSPGQAMVARFLTPEGMVSSILVREDEEHLEALGAEPLVEVRLGLLATGGVAFVVIMTELAGERYEAWIDAHNPAHAGILEDLASQEVLLLQFFGDDPEPVRRIWVPNDSATAADRALSAVVSMPAWSAEDARAARHQLFDRYPSVAALWEAIGPTGSRQRTT
ncbi:MAG: hypothetical protein MUE34_13410 [Acidimicrobiales bacterium]|jgi:hypothetical protein|nr:hypothetical protein [Acidimicrobiales bacterium]